MFDQIRKCLQISPSLPDGHCFLYSIIKSCSTQLTPGLDTDVRSIFSKMNSELAACPHFYAAFMKKNDISAMKTAFHNYTVNKKYNTRFGDVVPLLCANALRFNIVILNDSYNVSPKVVFSKSESQACVFIYKKGDHYDGLIPMEHIYHDSREPLWQSGLTHDINAFSNKLLIRNKSDDSSMLSSSNGDDTEDSTEDFIYRLRMHRKSNPTNLIAGFLNINSIFCATPMSTCWVSLRQNSMIPSLMVNFMLIIMY